MTCTECGGTIEQTPVTVQTSCCSYNSAYACAECGRLHWLGGNAIFNRSGERAFINLETGQLYNKPIEKEGEEK